MREGAKTANVGSITDETTGLEEEEGSNDIGAKSTEGARGGESKA